MNKHFEELQQKVGALVIDEYMWAANTWGKTNNSELESYAVMLEEFCEAKKEYKDCKGILNAYWDYIQNEQNAKVKTESLEDLRQSALNCVAELIQLGAMAHKSICTIEKLSYEEQY